MKKLFYLLIVLLFFSCQKDNIEVVEELDLSRTVQNCTLIDPDPISGTVYFYGVYNNPGFSCILNPPPLGENCFVQDIFYLVPTEIWKQLEPVPNTRPSSNYLDQSTSNTLYNPSDFPTFDGSSATAANANDVYEAVVCDILEIIDNLPSLPSNQMYSIIFTSIYVDHAFPNTQANYVHYAFDIYINNI